MRLRREHRIGLVRLAARCRIAASTAHRILVRHHLPALVVCDRATGEPVRRYESSRPGELVHIDVKKLGRIPDGGGHKVLGRAAGSPNEDRRNGVGYAYLHTALDDGTRLAYTEDLPDETAAICAAFLRQATAWFASHGITVERVPTDNAWAYTKNTWRQTCHELGISPRWTRPGGHRPTARSNASTAPCSRTSDSERRAAFPDWLDRYNYHRPHTRHRRPPTSQPRHQPLRTAHLGARGRQVGSVGRQELGEGRGPRSEELLPQPPFVIARRHAVRPLVARPRTDNRLLPGPAARETPDGGTPTVLIRRGRSPAPGRYGPRGRRSGGRASRGRSRAAYRRGR